MPKLFETGNKNYVIRMACYHAIDDRDSMIDAYSGIVKLSSGDRKHIDKCKAEIRDFQKLIEKSYP